MNDLYFAPASNNFPVEVTSNYRSSINPPLHGNLTEWTPYKDFKATVLSLVCFACMFGIMPKYDAVPMWGLTETAARPYWRPNRGDYIVFYTGSGHFPYVATVDDTEVQPDLAKSLWPFYKLSTKRSGNASGEPYSHILYLDTVWRADVPEQWVKWLRNTTDNEVVIRGFSRVPRNRLSRTRTPISELVDDWTSTVVSTSIKRDSAKELSRAFRQGAAEDRLLSIALASKDVQPDELTHQARTNLLECLSELYPKW